ncbi:L,D-transpeptidase family protein [Aureimonas pseudogalii]|uniref:Lipoprotein-anchoring transpeptidase ErfK/SrfK n=1 Tax=Aureimonas pseudogalii TaxID=1744844 RepID=A0A7W6H2Y6_9HYPH|nr:L,D-transpeptidase [Aureimonas pseudogalii]MBB3996303.1 lipoprotein-anchoring transpeptidase ErfK/SrfK [Aureimonas pseudogalii]
MPTLRPAALLFTALLASTAAPALSAELSREAIDGATLEAFQQRQSERAAKEAEAAAAVQATPGETEAGETEDAPAPEGLPSDDDPAPDEAGAAAAGASASDEVDLTDTVDAPKQESADPFLIRLQVLLDRAHASPGVIDGFLGGNTVKAVRAYEEMRGLPVDGEPDADLWNILAVDGGDVLKTYEITAKDAKGPYIAKLPTDYAKLAELNSIAFRGPREMLAERFHMDEDLLRSLNPNADFTKAGTTILVADTGEEPTTKVTRIVVDKSKGELLAYAEDGALVLTVPASIGSTDTPSPSGEVIVEAVASRPSYTYNPKENFQQGKNTKVLTLPPGPNGPVGSVWIDLSKPTYGIHGTPDPSHIDKTQSHGCVRLTNWDAEALSKLVEKKVTTVTFQE